MADSDAAAYEAVTEYLYGLKARGAKYGIDRMALLAERIGHPERAVPCIHVAGTNGKGSVAAMIESMLRGAGWRTGLYTSPHLVHLGERVQVDRRSLGDEEILGFVRELRPIAEALGAGNADDHPSFFEYLTAMGFLTFARERCNISVIEVGLGGRLDATNVVSPLVSVITSISMDHCEILGDTIEQIAAEKAGIIKPGRPVVIGRVPPAAEAVIRRIAAERGARVASVAEEFGENLAGYPTSKLESYYQRLNAATATLAARLLGAPWRMDETAIARGLARVEWAGRWQRVRVGGRRVILDASHNPEGAATLEVNLARLAAETGRAPIVITGVLGAARAQPLLAAIARHAGEIHFAVPRQPRACGYEELEALVPKEFRGRVVRATVEGLFPSPTECTAGGPEDVVVVTGSIYLLGEVMARLEAKRPPEAGAEAKS